MANPIENQQAVLALHQDLDLRQVEDMAGKIETMIMDKYEALTQASYAELTHLCSLYNRKAQILLQMSQAK